MINYKDISKNSNCKSCRFKLIDQVVIFTLGVVYGAGIFYVATYLLS